LGRRKAAEELGMSEKNIRTCIKSLKRAGKLASEAANKFSIVTIINWESEQGNDDKEGHQNDQQGATNKH
jgi:predicted transcriptional regulator